MLVTTSKQYREFFYNTSCTFSTGIGAVCLLVQFYMYFAVVVCQKGTTKNVVEVRPVDASGSLKLDDKPIYENFFFADDNIKLMVHHPLSRNLYAFGKWVSHQHCVG